jgi:hypothetical protein
LNLVGLIGRLRACELGEPKSTRAAAPLRIALPLLAEVDPAALSLPVLTVLLAGLDAFNSYAFFSCSSCSHFLPISTNAGGCC